MKTLKLYPANTNFSQMFHGEEKRLREILGENVEIHHVGSTAVGNLSGKGIIDIMLAFPAQKNLLPAAQKLARNGYFFDDDNATSPERIFMASREHDSTFGDYHLHLVVKNGAEYRDLLQFRDALRGDDNLRAEYEHLKYELANDGKNDRDFYKKRKQEFIDDWRENV